MAAGGTRMLRYPFAEEVKETYKEWMRLLEEEHKKRHTWNSEIDQKNPRLTEYTNKTRKASKNHKEEEDIGFAIPEEKGEEVKQIKHKSMNSDNEFTWLADSGPSYHLSNNDEGMLNIRMINSPLKIGNKKTRISTKI